MYEPKKIILMFKPTLQQQMTLLKRYSDKYDIEGTDCFADILAIPAASIVLDPEKLTLQEMKHMNEIFKYDSNTLIVFTAHVSPRFFGVLGPATDSMFNDNMKYRVVTDLEKLDIEI